MTHLDRNYGSLATSKASSPTQNLLTGALLQAQDALLLDAPEAVDLGGEPIGHALKKFGVASDFVGPDSSVAMRPQRR